MRMAASWLWPYAAHRIQVRGAMTRAAVGELPSDRYRFTTVQWQATECRNWIGSR